MKTSMERILIVDDDSKINTMMREALEKEGFACGQAFSGTEATLLLAAENFDLVLPDLTLPGKSGEITVTLPQGMKATVAQPVNLRGEGEGCPIPVKDGKFSFELNVWAPRSFTLGG